MQGMYEWGNVAYFLAAWRAGSFVSAAVELRVDQTTVARRVEALEESFAVRLFDRTRGGLTLTAAGERALACAVEAERQHFLLEALLSGHDQRLEGVVRLSAADGLMNEFLIAQLAALQQLHPGIRLEIVTGHESSDLFRRQADFAVRLGSKPRQQSLKVRKLGSLAWAVYASRGYLAEAGRSCSARRLPKHRAVMLDLDRPRMPPMKWADVALAPCQKGLSCNSFPSMLAACRAGFGLTLLPCVMAHGYAELERVAFREQPPATALWLVVTEQLARSGRVRAAMDFVAEAVSRHADVLAGRPATS